MENYIIIGILLLVLGAAAWYVIRAKKKGKRCIGCPESSCPSKKGDGSACCCCSASQEKE